MEADARFNLDDIDKVSVDCVNGYIRDTQKQFAQQAQQNQYYNIPPLVNYLCCRYYAIAEKFSVCGEKGKISGHHHEIVDGVNSGWCCAFGSIPVVFNDSHHVLYEWIFQTKYESGWCLYGLWANHDGRDAMQTQLDQFVTNKGMAYAMHVGVDLLYNSEGGSMRSRSIAPKTPFGTEDIITMRLNTQTAQLQFLQNGIQCAETVIKTDREYRMVVCFTQNHCTTLLGFTQTKI